MSRYTTQASLSQRSRTQNNPLFLGTFSNTSLRYLQGTLEATYTLQSDGFGGGTYNHWFSVEITSPAWIILTKGGADSKKIQLSFYDLNKFPIEGKSIFQKDSVTTNSFDAENNDYYPYVGHAMSNQSDLYNSFEQNSLTKEDDRYYPLNSGKYLICVSSTRSEPLAYEVGLVVEFPSKDLFFLLESFDGGLIGLEDITEEFFLLDPAPGFDFQLSHDHSRAEWIRAWNREHQETDKFPAIFDPLITRP